MMDRNRLARWIQLAIVAAVALVIGALYSGLPADAMFAYGDLRPFPQVPNAGEYFIPWHLPGLGNTEQRPPAELAIAVGIGLLRQPAALQALAFLAEIPLAGLSMFLLARRLFSDLPVRIAVSVFYAINPLTMQEFVGGAIGLLWVYAWLPLIALCAIGLMEHVSYEHSILLALSCATSSVFLPHAAIFVFGPIVFGLLGAWIARNHEDALGAVRKLAGPAVVAGLLYVALLAPSLADLAVGYFRVSGSLPSLALADVAFTYQSSEPWNAMRLLAVAWPGTPLAAVGYTSLAPWSLLSTIVPLLGLMAPVVVTRKIRKGYVFTAAWTLATAVLVFDIAGFLGLLDPLFSAMPILLEYRTPVKLNYVMAFCVSLLLGFILASPWNTPIFTRKERRRATGSRRPRLVFMSSLVIVLISVSSVFPFLGGMQLDEYYGPSRYTVTEDINGAHSWLNAHRSSPYDFRTLWLPLDYGTFLKYQGLEVFTFDSPLTASVRGGSFGALDYIRRAFTAICGSDPSTSIMLGLASVKYIIVLNDATQYSGCRESDGFLLTNSDFLNELFTASSRYLVSDETKRYTIYENRDYLPPLAVFRQLFSVESSAQEAKRVFMGPNLLKNPDFGENLSYWVPWPANGADVQKDCLWDFDCAVVKSTRDGGSLIKQRIPVLPHVSYEIGFWWKLANASDAFADIIWYSSGDALEHQRIGTARIAGPQSGSVNWTLVSALVEAPANAAAADLYFAASAGGSRSLPPTMLLARPAARPVFSNPGGHPQYEQLLLEVRELPSFSLKAVLLVPSSRLTATTVEPNATIYFNYIPGLAPSGSKPWLAIIEPRRTVSHLEGQWRWDGPNATIVSLTSPSQAALSFEAPALDDIEFGLLTSSISPIEEVQIALNDANLSLKQEKSERSGFSWLLSNSTSIHSGVNRLTVNVSTQGFAIAQVVVARTNVLEEMLTQQVSDQPAPNDDWSFSPSSGYELSGSTSDLMAIRISQAFSEGWESFSDLAEVVHVSDGTFNIFLIRRGTEEVGSLVIRYRPSSLASISYGIQAAAWLLAILLAVVTGMDLGTRLKRALPFDSEDNDWVRRNRSRLTDRLQAYLRLYPGQRILDLGSGSGYYTRRLFEVAKQASLIVACDVSRESLIAVRQVGLGIEAVRADAALLPFRSSAFDRVFLKDVLHHAESPSRLLFEIGRIARQDGLCILIEANAAHPLMLVLSRHGQHRHMSQAELVELVKQALRVVEVSQVEANPLFYYVWPLRSPMLLLWNLVWMVFQVGVKVYPPSVEFFLRLENRRERDESRRGRLAFNVLVAQPQTSAGTKGERRMMTPSAERGKTSGTAPYES